MFDFHDRTIARSIDDLRLSHGALWTRPMSYAAPVYPVRGAYALPVAGWAGFVKRAMDLVLTLALLLLMAVPMLAIAVLIRRDSPGPALFRQTRIGLNGQPFELLKFRTMHDHPADLSQEFQQATRHDPRVTRIGAWLRRTSLDELPQLLNVLLGEMSIVGPRPHAPGTRAGARRFEDVTYRYAARHRVRPGMTGLAQVRGQRGETDTEEKLIQRLESDLEYIGTWSLALDLTIIWRTAFSVLRMRNAY
ncbi:MAG: sugar transferase [Acetobacteraceae bacterium]